MSATLLPFTRSDFGPDFAWGTATAAHQIEGAFDLDGKSLSVWDTFSHRRGSIKDAHTADVACDFYHRYEADLELLKNLNFNSFRFSLAWTRILPDGVGPARGGRINEAGLAFYDRVIDKCLALGLEPWVTLYHWDLPQVLETKGGWTNPAIVQWFSEFADVCSQAFGHKVKHWLILNEPLTYTAAGYFAGVHAPGRRGVADFLPAIHHTTLCQAEGGRIVRQNVPDARIGTTFFCAPVEPKSPNSWHVKAAARIDALANRLFIEPALGLGYPVDTVPILKQIEKRYARPGDMEKLAFDFDFIGLQNYFRLVVRHSPWAPFVWAREVKPEKRGIQDVTAMGWEVYPEGMYQIINQFARYEGVREIVITENGVAYPAKPGEDPIRDEKRVRFYQDYLQQILRAKQEGANVGGFFAWTLLDNFEWAEGYHPRFGLVHVDFETQKRTVKQSGEWFRELLG